MQKLKGLWIPAEILLNENLSDKEKIILKKVVKEILLINLLVVNFGKQKIVIDNYKMLFTSIWQKMDLTCKEDCQKKKLIDNIILLKNTKI